MKPQEGNGARTALALVHGADKLRIETHGEKRGSSSGALRDAPSTDRYFSDANQDRP